MLAVLAAALVLGELSAAAARPRATLIEAGPGGGGTAEPDPCPGTEGPGDGEQSADSDAACGSGATTRITTGLGHERERAEVSPGAGISRHGRYAVFTAWDRDFDPGDTNGFTDVFVHDRATDATQKISTPPRALGSQANGRSYAPSISADGRYVAFTTEATNLVAGMPWFGGIVMYDRATGTTRRVDVGVGGAIPTSPAMYPSVSGDGRFVAFMSWANNLDSEQLPFMPSVYVRDMSLRQTIRIIRPSTDGILNDPWFLPDISADGTHVVFHSYRKDLVEGDTNDYADVFLAEVATGRITRVSVKTGGEQIAAQSMWPSVSADGRFVTFETWGDADRDYPQTRGSQVYIHDTASGKTSLVSVNSDEEAADRESQLHALGMNLGRTVSENGRYVVFHSQAGNLVDGDARGHDDVFVRDLARGRTRRVSVRPDGGEFDGSTLGAFMSGDGRHVLFMAPAGEHATWDVRRPEWFVGDRGAGGPYWGPDPDYSAQATFVPKPAPLLLAHGITGNAGDMEQAAATARRLVPGLQTFSSPTTANGSVWLNGAILAGDAQELLAEHPEASNVNLIAHSKGGLDSRAAMWKYPDLFGGLGMLATPNGGSRMADELCLIRNSGLPWIEDRGGDFGPCYDENDGLYNLQTGYMSYFNDIVRDWSFHGHWVAAGDCTQQAYVFGIPATKCDGASLAGFCPFGFDMAVCVDSAFARSSDRSDGHHTALDPVFPFNHTEMRAEPCATERVMAPLYGEFNHLNPWLDPSASPCGFGPFTAGRSKAKAWVKGRRRTPTARAASPALALEGQKVHALQADAGDPAELALDPEGGDGVTARVYVPAGVSASLSLADGAPASATLDVETSEAFGASVHIARAGGLAGGAATLRIEVDKPTAVGATTWVERAGFSASADVRRTGSSATIEVRLTGLTSGEARRYRVTAGYDGPSGRETVALSLRRGTVRTGTGDVFAAVAELPTGGYVPVHVNVDGPRDRFLIADAVLPDESAILHPMSGDTMVDTNGDGTSDALRLKFPVTASTADEYHLSVDLHTPDGTYVASAGGDASLIPGDGSLYVDVPLEALFTNGIDGPYEVVNALLTRGTDTRRKVVTAATLGTTQPYELADVTPASVEVSRPMPAPTDWDGDGSFDELRFGATATVPQEGTYAVKGNLVGPRGVTVGVFSEFMTLSRGANAVTATFPASVVRQHGSGKYQLMGLSLVAVDDARLAGGSPPAAVTLDAGQWAPAPPTIARLRALWDAANNDGAVSNLGLYTSERERLERIDTGLTEGRYELARGELVRFVDRLGRAGDGEIDGAARDALTSYAMALYAELPIT
jgi:Tol biopolymer transport system component